MDNIIQITVILPLLGFLVSGIFYNKLKMMWSVSINSAFVSTAAILSLVIFYDVVILKHNYNIIFFRWISIEKINICWSIYVDVLSALMLSVVTIVSAVVHIYSAGYMSRKDNLARFMSYLSLFTFFMLLLVTSDNIVQLFCGWEGVGLCSYLLIGYWYNKDSSNNAALKAFLVNRIADVFFLIGLLSLFLVYGSFEFNGIFSQLSVQKINAFEFAGFSINAIDFISMLLFIGCMGKSAQILFHVWLPDAMEGPTPVSALIHAATMVTAGVFLVVRLSPIFAYSEFVLATITIVGAITCFFAATIALFQNDIKKIIAYSTCSQLGYMFFACGLSAYSAAIFHLGTHAFFKALLFLGAGSVIHSLSGEQDIRRMGGLWKKIPFTYISMIIGVLALAGIFPFAGYFSKDMILNVAYAKDTELGYYAYSLGMITVFLTAAYSVRLIYLVFHGKGKTVNILDDHSISIRTALVVLAFCSIFVGVFAVYFLKIEGENLEFWNNSIMSQANMDIIKSAHNLSYLIKFFPLIVTLVGIFTTWICLKFFVQFFEALRKKYADIYAIVVNKFYFDEIYDIVFVQNFYCVAEFLSSFVETRVIDDKGPKGVSRMATFLSGYLSKIQTGFVYNYIAIMVLFIVVILAICLVKGMM